MRSTRGSCGSCNRAIEAATPMRISSALPVRGLRGPDQCQLRLSDTPTTRGSL
ncbi:hypothetical protein [Lysobacter gummosus]|uniref:hypothetical protein n=1 Tax=Lysobacter gummosus TaxID=262324 RepID=UPI0036424B31